MIKDNGRRYLQLSMPADVTVELKNVLPKGFFIFSGGCGQLLAHSMRSGAYWAKARATAPVSAYAGGPTLLIRYDATLFDLLAEWVPNEVLRGRILVQNPEEVYGFQKTS